jgi:hypothetical protein
MWARARPFAPRQSKPKAAAATFPFAGPDEKYALLPIGSLNSTNISVTVSVQQAWTISEA